MTLIAFSILCILLIPSIALMFKFIMKWKVSKFMIIAFLVLFIFIASNIIGPKDIAYSDVTETIYVNNILVTKVEHRIESSFYNIMYDTDTNSAETTVYYAELKKAETQENQRIEVISVETIYYSGLKSYEDGYIIYLYNE